MTTRHKNKEEKETRRADTSPADREEGIAIDLAPTLTLDGARRFMEILDASYHKTGLSDDEQRLLHQLQTITNNKQ